MWLEGWPDRALSPMIGSLLSFRPPNRGLLHQVCCTNSNWLLMLAFTQKKCTPRNAPSSARFMSAVAFGGLEGREEGGSNRGAVGASLTQQSVRFGHAERPRGADGLSTSRGWPSQMRAHWTGRLSGSLPNRKSLCSPSRDRRSCQRQWRPLGSGPPSAMPAIWLRGVPLLVTRAARVS
jgi:hypothetical protein